MKKTLFGLILLLLAGYISISTLFQPGYFPMHDDTQVGRVIAMGKALRNGQFPVRWVSDLGYGYGYPIFNFYGPLPYYAGGILYALGVDPLDSTKVMLAAGFVGAALTFFLMSAPVFGRLASLVGSVFYLFAPYHAVQLYVRGSVGEFWSTMFLPMAILGILRKSVLLGGIGVAGVILSHTILGYVTVLGMVFTLCGYATLLFFQKKYMFERLVPYIGPLVVGLLLSAFFWLPAIAEMGQTAVHLQAGGTADFHSHFVCLSQLWRSDWGFGGSAPGCIDGMSFMVGKVLLVVSIGCVFLFLFFSKKMHALKKPLILGIGISIISLLLTMSISSFIWDNLPGFSYIQYPWRFLTYAIFGMSLLVTGVISMAQKSPLRYILSVGFLVLCLWENVKFFQPQSVTLVPKSTYESIEELRYRVSKISDEYLPPAVSRPLQVEDIVRDTIVSDIGVSVEYDIEKETYEKFFVTTQNVRDIVIHKAFFPGWQYWVNGRRITPVVQNGLPLLPLEKGRNVVELVFADTFVRVVGNYISLIALSALLYFYGRKTFS